ncbi:MAG: hypothetical protein ACPG4X_14700 [Pikeienuella sp.]
MAQVQFAVQAYEARALQIAAQRCVNYYAEAVPREGKSQIAVYNAPGIKSFSASLAGAVRGAEKMAGVPYFVAGNTFYSVASDGTATSLGTINTAGGYVSMAVNRATQQQLCFVDGTDGWIYDTTNGLQRITDVDFMPADTVAFQDGYFIFNRKGSSQWFLSAIDDGLSITATDFADAEGSPDEVVAVYSDHREVWVFGEETIEVYYNSGNNDFPFERISGTFIERGCAAAFSIADEDNTLFWLGDDKIVYRAQGYSPQRISTHAIENAIEGYPSVSDAYAFFVSIGGHKFYHLTFPSGQATWVYDVATGLWHERESVTARYWRAIGYVQAYGKHLIGDAFVGQIGELDRDTFTEYGSVITGIITGPVSHADRKRINHRRLEIDIESGVGDSNGAASDPQMWLDYSDDGGRTWSAQQPVRSMGKIGEYLTRLRWLRMGQSRNRVYRLTVADAVKRSIIGTYIDSPPSST